MSFSVGDGNGGSESQDRLCSNLIRLILRFGGFGACRMAINRNARSLVALPDFPELTQAVRYGVPELRKQLGMVSPNSSAPIFMGSGCRAAA